MNCETNTDPILEPEILPPVPGPDNAQSAETPPVTASLGRRVEKAFGPIIGGLIIDFIDLATFGPIGIFCGMIIGGTAAYWICSIYKLPLRQRLLWSAAAGIYCTVPLTEVLPLATILGAYLRFNSTD